MKTVFADTYYFLAIGNSQDQGYQRAIAFAGDYRGRLLTTEWVLTEVADALASPTQRPRFRDLMRLIDNESGWTVVESSHELFVKGTRLFAQRHDKYWSLTDCISFVVMESEGLSEALTADRHFEQAGFVPLLV